MKHILLCSAALVLVISAYGLAGDVAPAPAEQAIKLAPNSIKSPEAILSPADISGRVQPSFRINSGAVISASGIVTLGTKERTKSFTIGGRSVVFELDAKANVLMQVDKDKAVTLRKAKAGFSPEMIALADGRKYTLAFPFGAIFKYTDGPMAQFMVRNGGVQAGRLGGDDVFVYDGNLDGAYDVNADGFRIGRADADVFAPFSELVAASDGVYKIAALSEDGGQIKVLKQQVDTGTLSVKSGAQGLTVVAAIGSADAKVNLVASAGSGGQKVKTAPGSYKVLYGLVMANGKAVAGLHPGTLAAADVAAGKTAEMVLCEKPSLEFAVTTKGGKIEISPASFAIKGKGGDAYEGYAIKATVQPSVSVVFKGREYPSGKMEFG
jgi:hypothetical protein